MEHAVQKHRRENEVDLLRQRDHDDQRLITFTPMGPRSAGLLSRSAAVYESLDAAVGLSHAGSPESSKSSKSTESSGSGAS